ncbi:MAG TPA: right-handed parallel beta-helix repeat-containing protein [Elusimicrobiota bacterium]|nr:right-handed parallel beta-helix repeat-containing protein [Elusimicrobiota bacterium]
MSWPVCRTETLSQGLPPGHCVGFLPKTTRWSGEVRLLGDVVVPSGAVLEVDPGTQIRTAEKPLWKYKFLRSGDRGQLQGNDLAFGRLICWGRLVVRGTTEKPVRFLPEGKTWGGIVLLGRARADMEWVELSHAARAGVLCHDRAHLRVQGGKFSGSETGLSAAGFGSVSVTDSSFFSNGRGILSYDFAAVLAEGDYFFENQWGVRADDASFARMERCSFRNNSEAGLLGQGRAWIDLNTNAFEGHEKIAVFLQDKSHGHARGNRFLHNAVGYEVLDDAHLVSDDDKIGPGSSVGVRGLRRARLRFRRAFLHGHLKEAALQTQDGVRAEMTACRFWENGTAISSQGKSRLRLRECEFQKNASAGKLQDRSVVSVVRSRLSGNKTGLEFCGGARGSLEENEFRAQSAAALDLAAASRVLCRRNRFDENGVALELKETSRAAMSGNHFLRQGSHGVLVRHRAAVRGRGNLFEDNAQAGVQGLDNARLLLAGNTFQANAVGVGIGPWVAADLRRNVFQGQRREGVSSSSEAPVVVKKNIFSKNATGIGHFEKDRALVKKNSFLKNSYAAGTCGGTAFPRWEENRCVDNGRGLVCRDRSGPFVQKNYFEGADNVALLCVGESVPRVRKNRFVGNKIAVATGASSRPGLDSNRWEKNGTETMEWRGEE